MGNKEIIDKIKTFLKGMDISISDIYLFGSRGRGDHDAESDYDILIVLKENLTSDSKRKLAVQIRNFLIKSNVLLNIDLIITNLEDWEWESVNIGFLAHTVRNEGILL